MSKKIHLFTPQDVKKAREFLLKEQNGIDPVTKLVIPDKQSVLDHDHKTQYVRAVLHRQVNVLIGKIENAWLRYMSWWYTGTLPEFLRGCADYLEKEHPKEYVHPKFINKLVTEFNKLKERDKDFVLNMMGEQEKSKNGAERKIKFVALLKTGKHDFDETLTLIRSKQ